MEGFGKLLRECIEQQNLSISQFVRTVNINRGWLYNVFEGKKPLAEEKLQTMLQCRCFSAAQEALLRESYYADKYEGNALERLLYIKRAFACLAQRGNEALPLPPVYVPQKSTQSIASEPRITGALRYLLERAGAEGNDCVYTNYPFSCEALDETVYAVLAAQGENAPRLQHIVPFERTGVSVQNLRNLFSGLRYFRLRHNVYYYHSGSTAEFLPYLLFPSFFLSDSCLLLFHPTQNSGLFSTEPELVAAAGFALRQQLTQCTPLARFPKDEMELKQLIMQSGKGDVTGGLSYDPCFGKFADCELLDAVVRADIPARDTLIQILANYYKKLMGEQSAMSFYTREGFVDFAKSGRLHEASENLLQRAAPELRARILRMERDFIAANSDKNYLLDERRFPFPKEICMDFFAQSIALYGIIRKGPERFSGEFFLHIDDPVLAQDFHNLQDYILRNRFYYPQDYTLHFLKELEMECGVPL